MSESAEPVAPEYVDLEHGDIESGQRDPMELVVNPDTPDGDVRALLMRLEDLGYAVHRQYAGEHQSVYTLYHPGYDGGESP